MTTTTIPQFRVKRRLTPKRRTRHVETHDYGAFSRRVLKAYSRRVANGDIDAFAGLLQLITELNTDIDQAVAGLRQAGYSWSDIAEWAGMTRQAAHQRWAGTCR